MLHRGSITHLAHGARLVDRVATAGPALLVTWCLLVLGRPWDGSGRTAVGHLLEPADDGLVRCRLLESASATAESARSSFSPLSPLDDGS